MRMITQMLVNFLLNALWQVAAIAAVAALGDYLLRQVTRFRHLVWVAALLMSLVLPGLTALSSLKNEAAVFRAQTTAVVEPAIAVPAQVIQSAPQTTRSVSPAFHVSQRVAIGLLAIYLMLVVYRSARLIRAWIRTRATRRRAADFEPGTDLQAILERCQSGFGVARVSLLTSTALRAPATIGIIRGLVILPQELLREGDANALTAAIGHEIAHIARRDYLLNLIYELILLPLSFHPAAALIKRQITKTRELRCDELVAERLLQPEVYARSLVRLAGWAMPFNRRAQTIIVGIADADILEVRIMSLLKRTKSNLRRNIFLLIGAALLLAIPGVVAASFAINFDVDPASAVAQEPSSGTQERKETRERQAFEREMKERAEKEDLELKQKIERETNPEARSKLEQLLVQRQAERAKEGYAFTVKLFDQEGMRREREIEARQKAELARQAKISMDQAIQIATSSSPGKVLECSLVGERRQERGEPEKSGRVLYHVVILSGDEANPVTNHVLVNAVDGSIVSTEKEERKRENPEYLLSRNPIQGGVLNGKAISLPPPEYPEIARRAKASGDVTVEITIDETGHVIAAHAVSGHPLLQAAAVAAARQAIFTPTRLEGEPIKVGGALVYNFVTQ